MAYSSYHPTMTYASTAAPVVGQYTMRPGTTAQPARLVVTLPADAKLIVDGNPTTLTSSRRVFASPPLQQGRAYRYTLQAQVTRNGQTLRTTRNVIVRAGQETDVTLDIPTRSTATARR
jgi:uncharacterized protein (TIGR03000 family)